jgi:hypothetical protein
MKKMSQMPRPIDLTSTVKLVSGSNVMVMARCYSIQDGRYLYDVMHGDRKIEQYVPESTVVALIKPPLNDIKRIDLRQGELGPDVIRGASTQ